MQMLWNKRERMASPLSLISRQEWLISIIYPSPEGKANSFSHCLGHWPHNCFFTVALTLPPSSVPWSLSGLLPNSWLLFIWRLGHRRGKGKVPLPTQGLSRSQTVNSKSSSPIIQICVTSQNNIVIH